MARLSTHGKTTLDARFSFADTAFPGGIEGWNSQLRLATGIADGEHYLLRLFKKTGTALDEDLKRLIARGLRRVRRVLSSRRARELLVEVLEVVEDGHELGILMVNPGSPICGSSHRVRSRESRLLTTTGRKVFWRNIARVAEGIALCHNTGIVHGAISEHAIFSHSDEKEDFRLGGYEACVHIADGDMGGGAGHLLRPSGTISFRQDWSDLGQAVSRVLGLTEDGGGPSLLSIERRMLNRLVNPPQYQLFHGNIVLGELAEVVSDLERSGSSGEGELVLYPSPQVTNSDFPALTSGTVPADDRDAVFRFVDEDLSGPVVRIAVVNQTFVRVVTDLAAYGVKVVDDCIGVIENASKRRPDDYIYDAVEVRHRLHLTRTRKGAEERARKLGPGAKPWIDANGDTRAGHQADDIPTWYALILLEVSTWLREQFRIYPVEILHPPSGGDADLAWIASREDDDRDIRRNLMGLRPAYDALSRELKYDDGKSNWTLSRVDTLAGDRERVPELSYEGTGGVVDGHQAFTFATSEAVVPGQNLYLRPRPDSGFERAIRRRLQNIVAARTNIELLRAIDDPAQVALDDVLRDIAAPGAAPDDMDASKKIAWDAIVSGKSINVVVGPPGVGKTFLISHLVKSILEKTPDARLLVSAQNHETLIQMEDELKKTLPAATTIVVRVERTRSTDEVSSLRESSVKLLRSVSAADDAAESLMVNQRYQIKQALQPVDGAETTVAERVFRDTDNLLLRSSDVTLATTSSHIIEEMIADGEQFDWVIVEEAARANGAELIGALLLGNRRIMVGDHNQLSPFDAVQRQKFYDSERAAELLRNAKEQLETISDLPPEVNEALDTIKSNKLLMKEVLATAARLEEPFRSIAEREVQREKDGGRPSAIVNTLLEQSRMHPAISDLVSNTFYDGKLVPSDRVKRRALTVTSTVPYLAAPIVLLDFPPLSMAKRRNFELKVKRSYRNELEASALIAALKGLRPVVGADGRRPTLVILSPYLAQVNWFKHLLDRQIAKNKTLFGFASPRSNGEFIFTSDSFQGGEADVIVASLTRNNVMVGSRALGFVKSPQRMNVLLSRAKQKLVLATSQRFIREVVDGIDPDAKRDELEFLRKMLKELARLAVTDYERVGKGASIVKVDENGRFPA